MPSFCIPRNVDGTGLAFLHCSDHAAEQFRFDRVGLNFRGLRPGSGAQQQEVVAAWDHRNGDRYRIAVPGQWASGGYAKVRFRLAKGTPKRTLEVIARHLDLERIEWFFFTNESGAQIRGARFRSHRVTPAA